MSLVLNKPIILANKQNITFTGLSIVNSPNGLQAILIAKITDENDKFVEQVSKTYEGAAFDSFWRGFNSGTFLYQEIAKLTGAPVPTQNSMESLFVGKVGE